MSLKAVLLNTYLSLVTLPRQECHSIVSSQDTTLEQGSNSCSVITPLSHRWWNQPLGEGAFSETKGKRDAKTSLLLSYQPFWFS